MDLVSRGDIDTLLDAQSGWYVSAYLPTVRTGTDSQQNPIRARKLLDQAEQQLLERGMKTAQAQQLLQPGRDLLQESSFWNQQADSLAIFCAEDLFRAWRLPMAIREFLWCGKAFYLKPLWPLLGERAEYYVLAVSQNQAALFQATSQEIRQVQVEDLPSGMAAALHYDQPEGMFQTHSGQPALRGKESAVFTGQGGSVDPHKDDIVAYFRQLDAAVCRTLDQANVPLLFAGVEYLFPLYQQVNSYPHLAATPIEGNFDHLTPHELHQRSLDIARPLLQAEAHRDSERYQEALGSGLSTADLAESVRAAFEGRIDALFVATDTEVWGEFDATTFQLHFAVPGDRQAVDLLDLAATEAYRRGARVYAGPAKDLPGGQAVATLLRHRLVAAAES